MFRCGRMTAQTADSGLHRVESQPSVVDRIRCMASETLRHGGGPDRFAHRLRERPRPRVLVADGDVQPFDLTEIADAAFIKLAIFFEKISLPHTASADGP